MSGAVATLTGIVRLPSHQPAVWWLPTTDGPVHDVGPSRSAAVFSIEEEVLHFCYPRGDGIDVEIGLIVAQPARCGADAIVLVGIFRCPHHVQPRWHAIATDAGVMRTTGQLCGAQGRPQRSATRAAADAADLAEAIRRRIVGIARALASGQVGHA